MMWISPIKLACILHPHFFLHKQSLFFFLFFFSNFSSNPLLTELAKTRPTSSLRFFLFQTIHQILVIFHLHILHQIHWVLISSLDHFEHFFYHYETHDHFEPPVPHLFG
ncbi:hypothetical protein ACP275_13G040700 [Erythranthe tilingii]